jgi:putative heme iron utilization protein
MDEIVSWILEREPENAMQILVAIGDAMEDQPTNVVEAIAEQAPEMLAEFSQELVSNMLETEQNLRPADREESVFNESVEEFISTISESAPEQVKEISLLVEQSIQEHEENR